jgi:pimeloyl-ACP methyl ester carboxylesterase
MQDANGIEFEVQGAPGAEADAVLMIHGAIVADSFLPMMSEPALSGYQLIRYRRRGYGLSAPPSGPSTIEGQANDARTLLDHLGVQQAHVVAHSGGGPIAVQLALDAPEMVRSLVLFEPALQNAAMAAAFDARLAPLVEMHRAGEQAKAVHLWMRTSAGSDWRDRLEVRIPGAGAQATHDAAGTFEHDLAAMRVWDFDAVGASRITQPVLHVVGALTAAGRYPVTDMLHAAVPSATLVTIPDADHTFPMTAPDVAAEVVAAFLRQHPMQSS